MVKFSFQKRWSLLLFLSNTFGWIPPPSATPLDARAHEGKIGFSIPVAAFPCISQMQRRLRRKEYRVGSKRWGVGTWLRCSKLSLLHLGRRRPGGQVLEMILVKVTFW